MVMEIRDLETFRMLVKSEKLLVVMFYDESILTHFACEPEFALYARQNKKYTFAKVDINAVPEAAAFAEANSMTTFNFYKRGNLTRKIRGYDLWSVRGHLHETLVVSR